MWHHPIAEFIQTGTGTGLLLCLLVIVTTAFLSREFR